MRSDGIKPRSALVWSLAVLASASPAWGQIAPLRFDARLLPAGPALGVSSRVAQAAPLRYDVRPLPAGAVLAGTIALALVPSVYASRFPTATCAPCDPSRLWSIDRGTVGQVRFGAAKVSDAFLYAALGGGGLLVFADDRRGRGFAAEDLTVFAQSVATADALTAWAKVLFHRPRPFRYVPAETTITTQSGLSFPSGHSTASWAAAFAYWSIQARHGRAHEKAPQIALLLASAVTTGVFRVVARQHFPTDVIAGAAIGATIGWFVPRLYPLQR